MYDIEDAVCYIIMGIVLIVIIGLVIISGIDQHNKDVEKCSTMENGNGIYDMEVYNDNYYIYYCSDYEPEPSKEVSKEIYNEKAKVFFGVTSELQVS